MVVRKVWGVAVADEGIREEAVAMIKLIPVEVEEDLQCWNGSAE